MTICKEKGFIESVDKDIVLWFHNNSFRGLYKEKVVLIELTDRILNVKPTRLQEVQGLLIDETGNDDVLLKSSGNAPGIPAAGSAFDDDCREDAGVVFLFARELRCAAHGDGLVEAGDFAVRRGSGGGVAAVGLRADGFVQGDLSQ